MAINVQGFSDPSAIQIQGLTPAIQALSTAVRDGSITFDQINSHFEKGVRRVADAEKTATDMSQSKADRSLIPAVTEAKKKILEAEALIRPLQTEKTRRTLQSDLDVLPLQSENARRKLVVENRGLDFAETFGKATDDLKVRSLREAQIQSELAQQAMDSDPTGHNLSIYRAYTANGRPALVGADGQLDYAAMQAKVGDGEVAADLEKAALTHGVNPYNADGTKKTRPQLFSEISQASIRPKPRTADQLAEEREAIALTENTVNQLRGVANLLFKRDASGRILRDSAGVPVVANGGVVGPVSGSPAGQVLSAALSLFGGTTRDKQRQLEMLSNEIVREKTAALKGPLSEKELAFLQKSVPGLSDSEATWDKYLRDFIPLMENSLEARRRALEAGSNPNAATAPVVPAPTTPAPAGAIPSTDARYPELSRKARRPTTVEDLSTLREGDPYFYQGHLLVW